MSKSSKTRKQANGSKKATQGSRPQQQTKKANRPGRGTPVPKSPGKLSSAPVIQGRQNQTRKPIIRSLPNGDCRIHHREYFKDMVAEGSSPSLFTSLGFPINPGMAETFPWLSQIAPRFEKVVYHSLKFDFETEAPTSLGGSVILTVDYDAEDAPPTSKVQAMAYKNAVRSPPWEECCHVSAKEDLSQQRQYFVRNGAVPAGADIKLYDVGNLFACSQNVVTGGAILGELYVEYDLTLMTPQLQLPSSSGIDSVIVTGNTSQTVALPFGTLAQITSAIQPPLLSYNGVTGEFTFNRAVQFNWQLDLVGTVLSAITITGTLGAVITANLTTLIDGAALNVMASTSFSDGIQANIGDTFKVAATGTTISAATLGLGEQAV